MKYSIQTYILLTGLTYAQSDTRWESRMLQIQIGGAVGIPELVSNQGSKPSLPVGEKGSRFELWGYKYTDGVKVAEQLLAPTEVGTYLPILDDIAIVSSDPYQGFHRCRVDEPFNVHFNVSGLLADGPDVPLASQSLLVEHYTDLYPLDSFDGSEIESTTLHRRFSISANGVTTEPYPVTNISAPDIARRSGKERFVVYALEDGATPQRVIGTKEIIIFPAAEGEFVGIDNNIAHKSMPEFSIRVWRTYPTSSTWVEMYEGPYVEGKRGIMLGTIENTGLTPEAFSSREFNNFSADQQPTSSGEHTFVLRTSSPFPGESIEEGGIVLSYQDFTIGNSITVKGMVSTME